jgi:hypothetical protein
MASAELRPGPAGLAAGSVTVSLFRDKCARSPSFRPQTIAIGGKPA